MNFILKIAPSFLKKFDEYLRVNHTWLWTTRIHLHLYASLLATILFSGLGLIYVVDIMEVPSRHDQNFLFGILMVPAVALALYFVYNMSLFNVDKSAGRRFKYQEFFLFIIYYLSFCLPLVIPFSASMILNERIDSLVENATFEEDKKTYNKALIYFPHDNSGDYSYFPSDTAYLVYEKRNDNEYDDNLSAIEAAAMAAADAKAAAQSVTMDLENSDVHDSLSNAWDLMRDSIYYHKGVFKHTRPRLYYSNSLEWNNSWNYDDYGYLNNFSPDEKTVDKSHIADSLFHIYLRGINISKEPTNARKDITAFLKLVQKYHQDTLINADFVYTNFKKNVYGGIPFNADYMRMAVSDLDDNISHIQTAKSKHVSAWDRDTHVFLVIFIFVLTVIFQVYKNVHWSELLISAGVAAVLITLIVFVTIMLNFVGIRSDSYIPLGLALLFLAASVRGFYITRFSRPLNQINILLYYGMPYFPVIILAFLVEYFEIFKIAYFDKYKHYVVNDEGVKELVYNDAYFQLVDDIWMWTFIGGVVMFVFVWNSYLKTLFLRYWSLPKKK